jgi:hypothetical protein
VFTYSVTCYVLLARCRAWGLEDEREEVGLYTRETVVIRHLPYGYLNVGLNIELSDMAQENRCITLAFVLKKWEGIYALDVRACTVRSVSEALRIHSIIRPLDRYRSIGRSVDRSPFGRPRPALSLIR